MSPASTEILESEENDMRRLASLCAATTIAMTMTACNQAPDTHDADVKALQDNETQWNQDWAAKDADKIAAHYADDAVVMVPGAPPDSGSVAIGTALKSMTSDSALSLQFKANKVDVAKSGDLGYTRGSYTMTLTDPQTKQVIHDHGSYVTTYRKQTDGSWKAVEDIATSEVPPPAPPLTPAKHK
jgi:uncharacterized protein (TIGR02246 family)